MDVQNGIVGNMGDGATAYIERVTKAVDVAHEANIPVMFIVVRFRKGYPEMSSNNKMFAAIRERFATTPMDENSPATMPVIQPSEHDMVIAKKRVSAFAGSDLEMILNAQGIDHLILCGIATSSVVLSTLRYAADKDYTLTVLSDCCLDQDEEVHRVLTEKVFPQQATVLTQEEWAKQVAAGRRHAA